MKHQRRSTKLLAGLLLLAQLLALTVFMAVGTSAAVDNPVKRTYVFYQADASMLDPETENKFIKADAWANIPWSEDFNNYSYGGANPPVEEYGARFQGMWAEGYLYYNIEIKDATPSTGTDWTKDGIVLSISETGEALAFTNDTACRKTATQSTMESREGSNQGFEYKVVRDDTNGIITVSVRYTFTDAANTAAGKTILLDIMAQNNLDGAGNYQQTAWHSINGATYAQDNGANLGTGVLSAIKGNAPVVLKINDAVYTLMEKDADNKVVLPSDEVYIQAKELFVHGNTSKPIYVTGVVYSNSYYRLLGWKNGSVSYVPGETITVADTIVLNADVQEFVVDENADVVLKEGNNPVGSVDKDDAGDATLPSDVWGTPVAGWLESTTGKLYAPGAKVAVGDTQIVLTAVYVRVSTQTGAAALISDPSALRFVGKVNSSDMTDYDAYIKGVGTVIVDASLLTTAVLEDNTITAEELTTANIAFTDAAGEKGTTFQGIKENITDKDVVYAASTYVVLQYEDGTEGRVYSTYTAADHSRSLQYVANKAYGDRSVVKTGDFEFKITKAHAIAPDFPGKTYSPYTEKQLDTLKVLAATTAGE